MTAIKPTKLVEIDRVVAVGVCFREFFHDCCSSHANTQIGAHPCQIIENFIKADGATAVSINLHEHLMRGFDCECCCLVCIRVCFPTTVLALGMLIKKGMPNRLFCRESPTVHLKFVQKIDCTMINVGEICVVE